MKLIKNHRGLSLIEVIVAFAILSIVSVMLLGFISSGSNTYGNINSEVSIQVESQVLMNQLQDYILDTGSGIVYESGAAYDGGTYPILYVVNSSDTAGTYSVCGFRFDKTAETLYFGEGTMTDSDISCDIDDLLAEHVSNFGVTFETESGYTAEHTTIYNATAANVTIEITRRGRTYSAEQKIALRNKPLTPSPLSASLPSLDSLQDLLY